MQITQKRPLRFAWCKLAMDMNMRCDVRWGVGCVKRHNYSTTMESTMTFSIVSPITADKTMSSRWPSAQYNMYAYAAQQLVDINKHTALHSATTWCQPRIEYLTSAKSQWRGSISDYRLHDRKIRAVEDKAVQHLDRITTCVTILHSKGIHASIVSRALYKWGNAPTPQELLHNSFHTSKHDGSLMPLRLVSPSDKLCK